MAAGMSSRGWMEVGQEMAVGKTGAWPGDGERTARGHRPAHP